MSLWAWVGIGTLVVLIDLLVLLGLCRAAKDGDQMWRDATRCRSE
jgi:hypothetical protein